MRLALLASLYTGSLALPAHAVELGGSASFNSDYVWRGTTQTQGDAAVQVGMKLTGDAGGYGQIWASNVDFGLGAGADSEFDLVVGWSGALADDWSLDLNLTHYRYPSTAVDLDWTELVTTAIWKQNYWLQLAWSPETLGTGENGLYAQAGAKFPVGETVRIEAAVGHYWLDDAYGDSYAHAQLGGVWTFKAPFELRVTAHGTDGSAERLFPGLARSRLEVALQASF